MSNFITRIFKKDNQYTPCWVIVKEGNRWNMEAGKIKSSLKDGVLVEYLYYGTNGQSFISHRDDFLFNHPLDNRMVFGHSLGELFGVNCRFEGQISSEYFHQILEHDIGGRMIRGLEDLSDNGPVPWKTILIVGGVILIALFLWKSGILSSLISSITGNEPVPISTNVTPPVTQPVRLVP